MRVHEFEFMIKVKWRIDLYFSKWNKKRLICLFQSALKDVKQRSFVYVHFICFGFIVKMRGNWVEEFNYTMKKLQLIRQIIEFSMTFFFALFLRAELLPVLCRTCSIKRQSSSWQFDLISLSWLVWPQHMQPLCPRMRVGWWTRLTDNNVLLNENLFSLMNLYISLTWLLSFPSRFGLLIQ